MPSLIQLIQYLLLILVAVLALKTISLLSEVRTSRGFVLKSFVMDKGEKVVVNTSVLERFFSFEKYKEYFEHKLAEAHMEESFSSFFIKRIVFSVVSAGAALGVAAFTGYQIYMLLAIPLGIVAFQIPKQQIKKRKAMYDSQVKLEMPEYLSAFAVLLRTHSPYEATKLSVEYAGPITRQYVEEMITGIDLYPSSPKPYEKFSEQIGLREVKEFVVALQQIMKVNSEDAEELIEDQIGIMNELQEEAYNEQIEERPDQVDKYVMSMIFPLMTVILTFIFILIADSFSNI